MATNAWSDLRLTSPVVAAASRSGSLGFLAGGYKSTEALGAQLTAVRTETARFGVNLFAPNPVPVDRDRYREYVEALRPEADRFGVQLPENPVEDDDGWRDKIDLLLAEPVQMVSFTFGIPTADVVAALRAAGSVLVQTVTSREEAAAAADAGVDALVVQASAAGAHSGTLTLIASRRTCRWPT
jgi:NAD(P)H-dependent flavin oxidoreductase YrpB (nitropropane dioxygenase family)